MDDGSSMSSSSRFNDALQMLADWLSATESYLVEDQPVLGDLDTVTILVEKHKVFQQEVSSRREMINSLQSTPGLDPGVRMQLQEVMNVWDRVQELSDLRAIKLAESQQLAEQFNEAIQIVRNWLPDAEAELKFHSIPDDEDSIMQHIENHEKFEEELRAQQINVDKIRYLAEEILQACHPNAVRFIKYYVTITQTRWEQAISRSSQRANKLHETLRIVRTNSALVEELMVWLADCHTLLSAKERDSVPDDLTVVEELVKEQQEFDDELSNRKEEVDRLLRSLPAIASVTKKSPRIPGRQSDIHDSSSPAAGAIALQRKWHGVLRMSADRCKKLQEVYQRLLEMESIKNFDFDTWRQRYSAWTRTNKAKYMDIFRRIDKEGTGMLTRKQFIDGMLSSKFPTSAAELAAVFNMFDGNRTGSIQYKSFVDTVMRPDKQFVAQRPTVGRPVADAELVYASVEDQLSRCQCHSHFAMARIDDTRYKFGDKDKVYQLKMLNGAVYVRFGSSWMPLEELLSTIDPCRTKATRRTGLNSRLSGSASNLSFVGKSTISSPRSGLGSGLAGQKNGFMAKSWSNLSSPSKSSLASSPSAGTQNPLRQLTFSTPTPSQMSYSTASLGRPQSGRRTTNSSMYPVSPPPSVGVPSLFGGSSTTSGPSRSAPSQQNARPGGRLSLSSSSSSSSQFGDFSTSKNSSATYGTKMSSAAPVNGRTTPTSQILKGTSQMTLGSTSTTSSARTSASSTAGRTPMAIGGRTATTTNGVDGREWQQQERAARPGSASVRNGSPGPSRQTSQLGKTRLYAGLNDSAF